jgi:hypothetical protein
MIRSFLSTLLVVASVSAASAQTATSCLALQRQLQTQQAAVNVVRTATAQRIWGAATPNEALAKYIQELNDAGLANVTVSDKAFQVRFCPRMIASFEIQKDVMADYIATMQDLNTQCGWWTLGGIKDATDYGQSIALVSICHAGGY